MVAYLVGQILYGAISAHGAKARLAYCFWQESGCPQGSALSDWLAAENALRAYANLRNIDVTI